MVKSVAVKGTAKRRAILLLKEQYWYFCSLQGLWQVGEPTSGIGTIKSSPSQSHSLHFLRQWGLYQELKTTS